MANEPDTGSSEEFPVGPKGLQKTKTSCRAVRTWRRQS
jgi:hypothetical protein